MPRLECSADPQMGGFSGPGIGRPFPCRRLAAACESGIPGKAPTGIPPQTAIFFPRSLANAAAEPDVPHVGARPSTGSRHYRGGMRPRGRQAKIKARPGEQLWRLQYPPGSSFMPKESGGGNVFPAILLKRLRLRHDGRQGDSNFLGCFGAGLVCLLRERHVRRRSCWRGGAHSTQALPGLSTTSEAFQILMA